MQIKKLTLFSTCIESQKHFYQHLLGFACEDLTNGFRIVTQENTLEFLAADTEQYYHFAFLIPTGSINSAIQYLENKDLHLLPYKGEKIIYFQTGKAIYFYDTDGNIVEFIERPLLDYPVSNTFFMDKVMKLNEIGLPHKAPLTMSNDLMNNYGITPTDPHSFREDFCWVGDQNGVIIVTKIGRNWLPTSKPGMINNFVIAYEDQGKEFQLSFENNIVKKML